MQPSWHAVADKVVIDYGCGDGFHAVQMAKHGAKQVIGIDIRRAALDAAATAAAEAKVSDRCLFVTETDAKADVVFSVCAFEHFAHPDQVLQTMAGLLKPEGSAWIYFGPPWLHPRGGHGLAIFPWAHILFSEHALMRWRSDYRTDGALRFVDREDGLNQMTIARFHRIVRASPFRVAGLDLIPIRRMRLFSNFLTREFLTSAVRCRLLLA